MYLVEGKFQNLTQQDIEILRQKGFTVVNESGSSMRTVGNTTVPAVVNYQNQTVTALPATWQEYTKDFNALFGNKFTVRISTSAAFPGGGIALGGFYENEYPGPFQGYVRNNTGNVPSIPDITVIVEDFIQSQFGEYIKTPADAHTLSKFAKFCASNPVVITGMRITSNIPAQLTKQPNYFEKISQRGVKENTLSTVAKPAIIVEQFQTSIANIILPEPFIIDGSSFVTYGIVGSVAQNSVLELAYAEVGSVSRGTLDNIKAMYDKYNKIVCG